MSYTDLSPAELAQYQSQVTMPADFKEYWETTLTQARSEAQPVQLAPVKTPYPGLDCYDVTFSGFAGDPIKAWLTGPQGFLNGSKKLPAVVEYIGYGGGRGIAGHEIKWAASGYIHFYMDTRGQGGDWGSGGDTPDPHPTSPATLGHLTNGVETKETMYYRRLITDAVRAIDTVTELECVDTERIILTGISQGGGLSLTAGTLHPQVAAILPDVAWLCDYHRGAIIADVPPYRELRRYLMVYPERVEETLANLAYVDGVNFARLAHAPAYFSIAMMDDCVPPSTTYGAYNVYAGEKQVENYPFRGHEGGGYAHFVKQIAWLKERGLGV